MGIRMVRQPSETPNVTNIDDIIPFRYAYGDQNGYVIGKGTEISPTIEGNTFRVNSGRVVLQGVETDIDANGVSFTIDNASETRYFVVYYEVNLATQTTGIKLSNYSTSGYPSIDLGDDLTANSSGTARMELYRFTATSGVISNVTKVVKEIEYTGDALVGYNISKGTIEERLTNLGFKEGVAQYSGLNENVSAIENSLKKQGKYVIFNFLWTYGISANSTISIKVPKEFYPKNEINFYGSNSTLYGNGAVSLTLNKDGVIEFKVGTVDSLVFQILNVGWETN